MRFFIFLFLLLIAVVPGFAESADTLAFRLIMAHETFRAVPGYSPAGEKVIGYGTRGFPETMTAISKEEAQKLLKKEIAEAIPKLQKDFPDFQVHELAAMISFHHFFPLKNRQQLIREPKRCLSLYHKSMTEEKPEPPEKPKLKHGSLSKAEIEERRRFNEQWKETQKRYTESVKKWRKKRQAARENFRQKWIKFSCGYTVKEVPSKKNGKAVTKEVRSPVESPLLAKIRAAEADLFLKDRQD